MLEIERVFLPNPNSSNKYVTYENQLQPKIDFASEKLRQLFYKNEDAILAIVQEEIRKYVNDDDLCNGDADMFPCKTTLTGEWYIQRIYFDRINYLSINTSLLGNDLGFKDDYLGLEIILCYDEKTTQFLTQGINSSSI